MHTKADTKRATTYIRVAEYGDGTPWLMLEPQVPGAREAFGAELFFGLDLKPGTTYEQAKELSRVLSEHVTGISVTTFLEPSSAHSPSRR